MVEKGTIFWNDDIYMLDWIESQEKEGVFGDIYSLQISANILQRDIIIIPTQQKSAHNPLGYILIESSVCVDDPIFLLYFEEAVYGTGHYQSIKPINNDIQVLKHYRWTKIRNRTSSIGEPLQSSSRLSFDAGNSDAVLSTASSAYRKVACHVCNTTFRKNVLKKKCTCGSYCHKKCVGKCQKDIV